MGENKHIEELDAFAKKFVKEIPQEKPSVDFTASLMQVLIKESKKSVYKPSVLISKKGWFLILGLVVATLFIPFESSKKSLITLPKFDFSFLDSIQIPNFLGFLSVSNTTMYTIFFFGLMILVQVVFLKNHFNKRFN